MHVHQIVDMECGSNVGNDQEMRLLVIAIGITLLVGVACEAGDGQSVATTETPSATTQRPQPTATSVPQGFARSNPAPYGTSVVHDEMEVTVLDVVTTHQLKIGFRILPKELADPSIYRGLTGAGEQHHEGLLIKVRVRNLASQDASRMYSSNHFRLTGERGIIYEIGRTPMKGGYLGAGEFFGGATVDGWIMQQFDESDRGPILIYSPPLLGSSYYALCKENATRTRRDCTTDGAEGRASR